MIWCFFYGPDLSYFKRIRGIYVAYMACCNSLAEQAYSAWLVI